MSTGTTGPFTMRDRFWGGRLPSEEAFTYEINLPWDASLLSRRSPPWESAKSEDQGFFIAILSDNVVFRQPRPCREKLARRLRQNWRTALEKLLFDVGARLRDSTSEAITPDVVAELLLPEFSRCNPEERERLIETLVLASSPEAVLREGLIQHERHGGEQYLEAAAAVLERFGARSFPALSQLTASGREECERFIFPIAFLEGVPRPARIDLLAKLASSPHWLVRRRVLEAAGHFAPREADPILEILANDPDEELREAAAELREQTASP
jgi:hypothetical protein